MPLIYKSNVATRSRLALAAGLEVMGIFGGYWLYKAIDVTPPIFPGGTLTWAELIGIIFVLLWSVGVYFFLNHPRFVKFLVETEAELAKVTWPSKGEFVGATIVVIVTTALVAGYLFVVDALMIRVLKVIGIY